MKSIQKQKKLRNLVKIHFFVKESELYNIKELFQLSALLQCPQLKHIRAIDSINYDVSTLNYYLEYFAEQKIEQNKNSMITSIQSKLELDSEYVVRVVLTNRDGKSKYLIVKYCNLNPSKQNYNVKSLFNDSKFWVEMAVNGFRDSWKFRPKNKVKMIATAFTHNLLHTTTFDTNQNLSCPRKLPLFCTRGHEKKKRMRLCLNRLGFKQYSITTVNSILTKISYQRNFWLSK